MSSAAPRHFSMLRGFHLADFFTLANAGCGVGAVFLALAYTKSADVATYLVACALLPAAHGPVRSSLTLSIVCSLSCRMKRKPPCAPVRSRTPNQLLGAVLPRNAETGASR